MKSNSQVGNYYKKKTRDWFIKAGFDCEFLERYTAKYQGYNKFFYAKKDLLGSDGIAMNGTDIIFWNSKFTVDLNKRKNEIINNN